MGIRAYPVVLSTPQNVAGTTGASNVHNNVRSLMRGYGLTNRTPQGTYYVHLSMCTRPLRPANFYHAPLLPVGLAAHPTPNPVYCSDKGVVRVRPLTSMRDSQTRIDAVRMSRAGNQVTAAHDHRRLVKVEGVADAVLNWDRDRIKSFVELLTLEVLPYDVNDPLRPELVQHQRLYDVI